MPQEAFIFLSSILVTALSFLYFRIRRKSGNGQQSLENAEQKSYQLLHQAMKKAQVILGQAELEEIKIIANSKIQSDKVATKLDEEISKDSKIISQFEEQQLALLSSEINKASLAYQKYLDQLRNYINQSQTDSQQVIRQQVNQLFEKFEQNLTDYLIQTEQRSVMAIDLELRATRQLVETYKNQQLKLIDENIIAMLEKTLSTVLAKKLTLRDQADLVYEALEKAKIEKFIV